MVVREEKGVHYSKGSYLLVLPIQFVPEHRLDQDPLVEVFAERELLVPAISLPLSPLYPTWMKLATWAGMTVAGAFFSGLGGLLLAIATNTVPIGAAALWGVAAGAFGSGGAFGTNALRWLRSR